VTAPSPEPQRDEAASLADLLRQTYDAIDRVVDDITDEEIHERLRAAFDAAGHRTPVDRPDVTDRLAQVVVELGDAVGRQMIQTMWFVRLTWAVAAMTVALAAMAVALIVDVFR
jgi:hypothetical protein